MNRKVFLALLEGSCLDPIPPNGTELPRDFSCPDLIPSEWDRVVS